MSNENMDFLKLCEARQSCRKFADTPVEHDKLVRCIEAASLTPSACNSQPWSFVVAETPEIVSQIAEATHQMGVNGGTGSAKAFIIVLEEHAVLMPNLRCMLDSQYFAHGDIGAATLSITMQAASMGLGSCILGVFDREAICKSVNLPVDKRIRLLVAIGYPENDKIRPKQRKPFEDIVRFV